MDKWVVYEAEMNYHEGITTYTYQLVQRANIRSMVKQNHRIQGVSLGGKVVNRGNNMVKVHLDVDHEHDEGGNWWFPYSSEGNNMFHALPEEGARINVYFPGGKEKQAIAINSVRGKHEEIKGRTVFEKPNTKVFHIPGNAKMELGEGGVLFEKNTVRVHLDANDISLEADENLMIVGAKGNEFGNQWAMADYIKMRAETSITLFVGQQYIEVLSQRVAIQGQAINLNKVEMSLLDMLNEEDLEELYVDSFMTQAQDEFKAEKKGQISPYLPVYGKYHQEKEIEITPAEKEQIRANVREKVRQDPDRKVKAKESASRRRIEDLKFHQKMLQQRGAEEQNPLTSEEKNQALQQYNSYYKSYVHKQMNRMDLLTDRNPQEALRQESDMLRASVRSQERKQAMMSSRKEPGLGEQLASAFLDWYNLEYIVPQKPNYLSKDQSEDTQYSRYYVEQFIISAQKAEAKRNRFWGGVEIGLTIGIPAIAILVSGLFTGGVSLYLLVPLLDVAAVAGIAHGGAQIGVSNMKLNELAEGNYYTPELDKWQEALDVSGTALAVVDLAMLAKAGGRGLVNLANDTKRAEMLTKINNPALKQGLNKVGTKLGQAGKMATGAYEDAKSALNVGKTGQLGLDAVGAGSSAGKTGSRAVDGAETWYSSGGKESIPKVNTEGTGNAKIRTEENKKIYTNEFGNEISWTNQGPKDIDAIIDKNLKSSKVGDVLEGQVALAVKESGRLQGTGIQLKMQGDTIAGDIDVLTDSHIIEVKKSLSALSKKQFDKLTNPLNEKYFNYDKREVIYFIEDVTVNNKTQENLVKMLEGKGIKIISSLRELEEVLSK